MTESQITNTPSPTQTADANRPAMLSQYGSAVSSYVTFIEFFIHCTRADLFVKITGHAHEANGYTAAATMSWRPLTATSKHHYKVGCVANCEEMFTLQRSVFADSALEYFAWPRSQAQWWLADLRRRQLDDL
jgi:hypothetical protein